MCTLFVLSVWQWASEDLKRYDGQGKGTEVFQNVIVLWAVLARKKNSVLSLSFIVTVSEVWVIKS